MKKSRVSDSQIMEVLKRADAGVKVPDLFPELGVSGARQARESLQNPVAQDLK